MENSDKNIITTLPPPSGSTNDAQPAISLSLPLDPPKHKRSTGLRLFDVVLYPVISNIGVFVISVAATYLTARGGDKDASGKLIYGETGTFFQKRGDWLVGKFKNMGMTDKSADMSKMVFFSFADGSLMAPLIKLLEDRREKIGRWCDKKLGTTPSDPNVYDKEPKQSWTSVLGGRAVTALVVVTTAMGLNSKLLKGPTGEKISFNDKMFINPGIKLGEWVKTKPNLAAKFGKHDVGELAKVSIFEAFYTSVCTAGLYFSSRLFARGLNARKERKEDEKAAQALTQNSAPLTDAQADGFIDSQEKTHQWAKDRVKKLVGDTTKPATSHSERYQHSAQEPSMAR